MLFGLVLCALVAAAHAQGAEREVRRVDSPQGPVLGYKENDIYVFHGIPYAKAPTGVDKFKAPLPPDTWTEPFEAVDRGIICPQVGGMPDLPLPIPIVKTEQEDCLIATVYAPDTVETNLPVVVYVHGGAYQAGWGDVLQPRTLTSSEKIISVTFNYRLGIHGFLCLGTSAAPGNAGLKDIVELLVWVRSNIRSYGGNPLDVTIAGYSAGASAVDLIILSSSATGLYHKVIPDSGANVASWSVQMDPTETARDYARRQDPDLNVFDIEALEEFYTNAPMEQLTQDDFINRLDSTFGFVPCIEKNIGESRFLDDSPVNILQEGRYNKVPMLYGFTRKEGLIHIDRFEEWSARMNERFSDFLPADLQFNSAAQKALVAQEVRNFYFGNQPVNEDTALKYIEYFTDVMFAYPTLRAVRLQVEAENENIYLYEYSFLAEEFGSALENVDVRGADHTAQTLIVLDPPLPIPIFVSNRSQEMQIVMRKLWLDFMTTGTPVPSESSMEAWPPVGERRSPHMNLDETPQLLGPLLQQRAEFWDNIYDRHYHGPIAPSSASLPYIHPLLALLLLVLKTLL